MKVKLNFTTGRHPREAVLISLALKDLLQL